MKNNKGNLVAFILIGLAALTVGFVTFVEFSKTSGKADNLTAAVSNATSSTTKVATTGATPKLIEGNPCSKVGQTTSETMTNSSGATLTFNYVCMACKGNFDGDKLVIPSLQEVGEIQSRPGTMCGSNMEVYNQTQTDSYQIDRFAQCFVLKSSISTMTKTENPAKVVTCTDNSCKPPSVSTTTLGCTVTTNTLIQDSYTPNPTSTPPGGPFDIYASMTTKQSINDTGCPNPARKVVSTCTVDGNTAYFGINCPPVARYVVQPAPITTMCPVPKPPTTYYLSSAAPDLVNKMAAVFYSIFKF